MMRSLLFIVPGFPADERDTSCLPAVQTYVRALGRLHPEIDLRVLALHYPYESRRYRWHGISVRSVGGANRGGFRKAAMWARAWSEIRNTPPSLIHSFWVGECAFLGGLASARYGYAHVSSVGGQELRRRGVYTHFLRRMSFGLAAGSPQAARTAIDALGHPVDAVIPLGLDLNDLPRRHGTDPQTPTTEGERGIDVLFVGSLIPVKRVEDFLQVASLLPAARFVVVGGGSHAAPLQQSAPENVAFMGHLAREEVLRLMSESKVLLHPSEYESQGYVLLEALASGMHVVCRGVGFAEASEHVHRCTSVGEMADVVRTLLARSAPLPISVPTVEESVRAYLELYDAAASRRAAACPAAQPTPDA